MSRGIYKKMLNIGWPNGRRIEVLVAQAQADVQISTKPEFDFLESVPENDFGLKFANGRLVVRCKYDQYAATIEKLTRFLENMIFAAMVEAEKMEGPHANKHHGKRGRIDCKRDRERDSTKGHGRDKSKKSASTISGIFSRSGRGEQTEDPTIGETRENNMASESDSGDRPED